MSAAAAKGSPAGGGKRARAAKDPADALLANKRQRCMDASDPELDSEIEEIVSLLGHIKEKVHKAGQKKTEEALSSVAAEIQTLVQNAKTKFEKESLKFLKTLSKTSTEYERLLEDECIRFEAIHDKFCKDKAAHVKNVKDLFSMFEEDQYKFLMQYELQRNKEKGYSV